MTESNSTNKRKTWLVIGLSSLIGFGFIIALGVVLAHRFFPNGKWLTFEVTTPTVQVEQTATPTTRPPRPTATATKAVQPAPTAEPAAAQRIVWNPHDLAVEMFDFPDGKAIGRVPNGTWATVYQTADVEGVTWFQAAALGEAGWMAGDQLWEIRDDPPLRFIASPDGANLREEPDGNLVMVLTNGTPLLLIEQAKVQGIEWVHVSTLDDRGGWVAGFLVSETP